MTKATRTNVRKLVQEIRNESAYVRNVFDGYGTEVRYRAELRESIEDSLNIIDGNSALLRELLVEPITEEW